MVMQYITISLLMITALCWSCSGQNGAGSAVKQTEHDTVIVGGGCETCELMYIGMPGNLNSTDTSTGWQEAGPKIKVSGTVYKQDGRSPAPGVILYYWQTDNDGYYSPAVGMDERVKQHGHIRGWMKTDTHGRYTLYTLRPAPYPGERMPAHIHVLVKEPGMSEYYIDDFVFDDDKFLTPGKRKAMENRGGNGIMTVVTTGGQQEGQRNIVLGLHIPGYPR
jgi:protocatechuate 3,4-dioxygenase beta subunit